MRTNPAHSQDQACLRRFVESRSEDAFRALVEKYTGLVYGVALRRTGEKEMAEEVAQNVFLALARKAGALGKQRSLGAWLHRAATLEALRSLRKDTTRRRQLAMIRDHLEENSPRHPDGRLWRELRPHLDDLLNRLPTKDREILVQHYLEGRQFPEIARGLGMSPAATQKRSAVLSKSSPAC